MTRIDVFSTARDEWLRLISRGAEDLRAAGEKHDGLERIGQILSTRLANETKWDYGFSVSSEQDSWSISRSILRAETGLVVLQLRESLTQTERTRLGESIREGELYFERKLGYSEGEKNPFDRDRMLASLSRAKSEMPGRGLKLLSGKKQSAAGRPAPSAQSRRLEGRIVRIMMKDGSDPEAGIRGVIATRSGNSGFEASGDTGNVLRRNGVGANVILHGKMNGRVFRVAEARPALKAVSSREEGER